MKKLYSFFLLSLISIVAFGQSALITGYVDSTCPSANGRVLEIYIDGKIDLSGWAVQRMANGGDFGSDIDLSSLGEVEDAFIYITNNQTVFEGEFGVKDNLIQSGTISSNGDDGFQIIDASSNVIDRFGEEGKDGSGESWEHVDGYYLRNSGSVANGGNFDVSEFTISAIDALDGQGTCNSGTSFSTIVALGSFTAAAVANPVIDFKEESTVVNEGENASIVVMISEAPSADVTVDIKVVYPSNGGEITDKTITFTPAGDLEQTVDFTFADNAVAAPDMLYGLELSNAANATIGDDSAHAIYVLDDEAHAPVGTAALGINFGVSYKITGDNPGSEIVAHDAATERLFVMNSGNASIEVLDFSDPLNITAFSTIDLSAYGDSGTSVAVMNGVVAATAVPDDKSINGNVVFFDTDGNFLSAVEVGSLPDMVVFTPDGTKVLTANEGEPSSDYTIDPEGTVSVIDISGGVANLTAANVTTLNFNIFDDKKEELIAGGIRIFGPGATVSQDLEPEYIAVSADSEFAWVTLQENNAVAVIGLDALQMNTLLPLGYKDHRLPENTLDASNKSDMIFMANWPIYGMYQPDAIATYNVGGVNYFVTANEGDAREYDPLEEEVDLGDITLDPTAFPNADLLAESWNLGKLKFTDQNGDTDGDGDYDKLYAFGGRSFSIYNQNTGKMVYDSGDDFERIIAEDPTWNPIFNATDDENEFKNRSDNKGPEPEAVIVKEIEGKWYAFVGLERVGGFVVYDITNPQSPIFEGYYNNRSTAPGEDITGDLAPEGIVYVKPEDNSLEKGLVVIANEVSATISVYTLDNVTMSVNDFAVAKNTFKIYPNPASGNHVFFAKPATYKLYDIQGRMLKNAENAVSVEVGSLNPGTYILTNESGQTNKVIIQ